MKYDLSKIKNFKALSKENILEIISEEEIMRHYLGFEFSLHKTYHSPLMKKHLLLHYIIMLMVN